MDFITRYAFPFYVFYGICSFIGFFSYSLENSSSWVVAFFVACLSSAVFIIISAISILPVLYLVLGIVIDVFRFTFRFFKR